jgi:ribosomal protein L37AE/L43A
MAEPIRLPRRTRHTYSTERQYTVCDGCERLAHCRPAFGDMLCPECVERIAAWASWNAWDGDDAA